MAGVQGSGLSFESYQAAGVSINIDVDTTDSANSIIDVSAEDVLINAQGINQFRLKAEGKTSSHMLQVSAGTKKESIRLSADAGYTDDVWHGNFTSSELDLADYGLWILKGKGAFYLSSKTAHTDNLCWINDSASVCVQTAWNDKNGLTGNTRLSNIPLTLFRPLIPAKINVEGVIEGDGNISFNNNHLYGHTAFAITEGSISYTSKKDGPVTILLEQATLETILNENALDVKTDVSLKERGYIKVGINLPHFTPMDINKEKQAISGRLAAELDMLDLIPRFTNTIENTKGIVLSDLGISGTLARPDVTGYMKLQGGQADILDLGIHLKDIRIDVAANKNRTLHLDGQCSSGSGDIMLQGEIHAAGQDKMNHDKMNPDKVNAELHIKGDNFETVKVPGLWLVASPDINIRLQDTIIAVDGKLSIPKALIEPPDLSKMVPVSKDVFIISGEPEEAPEKTWKLSSRIKLALGDNVRFNGYGLTCRIAGSIGITDEPGRATSSEGELRILDGQYKAYGKDLKIEKGRLIFVGLIDDPGLDVSAVRQIKDVRAGVRVAGTLKSHEISVFSVPSMDQSNALSYLLFGRPMSGLTGSEGGQLYNAAASAGLSGGGLIAKKIGAAFGLEDVEIAKGETLEESALAIGKYLSPKLYVNYGIGLFEPINTFRMRYSLTSRWMLQTEYGIESGGDIIYKIEH
jgi:translocation and assembly module TamB